MEGSGKVLLEALPRLGRWLREPRQIQPLCQNRQSACHQGGPAQQPLHAPPRGAPLQRPQPPQHRPGQQHGPLTVLLAAVLGLLCQYFRRAKAVSDDNGTII